MIQVPKGATSPVFPSMSLGKSGAIRVGPSNASAPTHIPGVIERLNLIGTLNLRPKDPDLTWLMPEHHLYTFTHQTGIGLDIMTPVLKGKVSYGKALKGGILQELGNLARGYEVTQEFEKIVYVPITEIHCPRVKRCKATYIHETKDRDEHFLNVKVFGFGGGSGNNISIGTGYAIPAEEDCRRVFIPVKLKVQRRKDYYTRKTFTSAHVVEIRKGYKVSPIQEKHFCAKNYGDIEKTEMNWEPYRLGNVPETSKTIKFIDIGKKTDFSWGIKLEGIGTKIGLNISVEVIRQVKYEYELTGGYDYIGYFPMPNSSIFCWTWQKAKGQFLVGK